jgi:hypothetical protein
MLPMYKPSLTFLITLSLSLSLCFALPFAAAAFCLLLLQLFFFSPIDYVGSSKDLQVCWSAPILRILRYFLWVFFQWALGHFALCL